MDVGGGGPGGAHRGGPVEGPAIVGDEHGASLVAQQLGKGPHYVGVLTVAEQLRGKERIASQHAVRIALPRRPGRHVISAKLGHGSLNGAEHGVAGGSALGRRQHVPDHHKAVLGQKCARCVPLVGRRIERLRILVRLLIPRHRQERRRNVAFDARRRHLLWQNRSVMEMKGKKRKTRKKAGFHNNSHWIPLWKQV